MNEQGSNISYKDLPVRYVKHKGSKESLMALLCGCGIPFSGMIGITIYYLMHNNHLHPGVFFGFIGAVLFAVGYVSVLSKMEVVIGLKSKTEYERQKLTEVNQK